MIKLLIFDLGGVVIKLGDEILPASWFDPERSLSLQQWLHSELAADFERGELSANAFAGALKRELTLGQSSEQIIEAFRQWPESLYPQVVEAIGRLKGHYKVVALSNTNEVHYPRIFDEFKLDECFDEIFASHIMGLLKPDAAAFFHVLDAMGCPASEAVFIDDNLDNILAAQELGLTTIHAKGEQQVMEGLVQLGLKGLLQ
ncbi:HAD family hydrolase [Aliagarivorans marinus]|uniref:HAD family hydrolase n=1 Tax=Aliagarivorans marinus TaxID=561965 RepID=UPI000410D310|nr:HAD family phosphatase [Aliagarivorans marinus]